MISADCLPFPHFCQFSLLPDSPVIWSLHSSCYLRATPCGCRKLAGAHKTNFVKVVCLIPLIFSGIIIFSFGNQYNIEKDILHDAVSAVFLDVHNRLASCTTAVP